MAGGLAASSPLTWHVVLRFTGAGRDHVEDLGVSVGGAVGSLRDAARQLRPRRARHIFGFVLLVSLSLNYLAVLDSLRWGEK